MNTNAKPYSKSLLRYENLTPVAIPDDSIYAEYERILGKYRYKTSHITGGKLTEHKPDAWASVGIRPMRWRAKLTSRPVSRFKLHVFDCENEFPGCRCFPLMELSAETCTLTHDDTVMNVKEATYCANSYGSGNWFVLVETPWGDEVWELSHL